MEFPLRNHARRSSRVIRSKQRLLRCNREATLLATLPLPTDFFSASWMAEIHFAATVISVAFMATISANVLSQVSFECATPVAARAQITPRMTAQNDPRAALHRRAVEGGGEGVVGDVVKKHGIQKM